MSNSIQNIGAIELNEQELDNVAGGLALVLGDVNGYSSQAGNDFFQKELVVAQQTSAGPNGSTTGSITSLKQVASSAGLNIAIS